jgi:tetrahedral aminopeptidase
MNDFKSYQSLISELCSTTSISGDENNIQDKVFDYFSKSGKAHKDTLGNTYSIIKGNIDKCIMVTAHADEIGLIVNYIDADGFIYFTNIGFIEPVNLIGQRICVNNAFGVISRKPSYFMNKNENSVDININDLWIDIGALSNEECEKFISIGDTINFVNDVVFLPNNKVLSKSLDNKAGLLTLLKVFEKISKNVLNENFIFASTVQEEIGFRGAKTIATLLKPQIAIIIDVTNATDIPESNKKMFGDIRIGSGPVICFGANVNRKMADLLKQIAIENNIPFQAKAFASTSNTEANIIQIANDGIITCVVAVPCRYMHTSYELISLLDIINAVKLIELLCLNIGKHL